MAIAPGERMASFPGIDSACVQGHTRPSSAPSRSTRCRRPRRAPRQRCRARRGGPSTTRGKEHHTPQYARLPPRYDPSFPLTNLPPEYRDFLKQGLAVVYAINTLVAGAAYFEARDRDQPVALWVVKCFFIGGVAWNQLLTSTRKPRGRR